jgi:hypothetical protein
MVRKCNLDVFEVERPARTGFSRGVQP